jgi:hypothetical protein
VPYRQISSRVAAIVAAVHNQVFIPHITIS